MNRFMTRGVLWVVASLAALAIAAPGKAEAQCLSPNGTDDTAAIQSALSACSGAVGSCGVNLCGGTFRIAPVRVADFRGVVQGAGRDATIIEALPELEVNDNPDDYYLDDPFDPALAPWPILLQFFGGEGTIQDLTVHIPTPAPGQRPTTGWLGDMIFELDVAILITGVDPVDYEVTRIRVSAGDDPLSLFDTTLLNGVFFQGRVFDPTDPGTYPVFPVRGSFSLSDSDFVGMVSGSPVAETDGATASIRDNTYETDFALHVQDGNRSRLWLVNNTWNTTFGGVQILMNVDGDLSEGNSIIAFGNQGTTLVPLADWGTGFQYVDPWDPSRTPGGTSLFLARNTFSVDTTSGPALAGIDAVGAGRLTAWSNVLRGRTSVAGINVDDTTGCRLLSNSLGTSGATDLALGPGTSRCLALVSRSDVVVDQGVDNRIVRR